MVKKKKYMFFEPKYACTHPFSCAFENWALDLKNRIFLSVVLSLITSIFSKIQPLCTQERCFNYFFELFLNPSVLFKPIILSQTLNSFLITAIFFFLMWIIILSIAVWAHVKRIVHEVVIPVIIAFFVIFILGVTSGAFPQLFLETDAIECVTSEDCMLAGYCGEVCTSVYQPVYTTFDPNCEPLDSCVCIENKCVGS